MDSTENHSKTFLGLVSEYVAVDHEEYDSVNVPVFTGYGDCPAQGLLLCYWNNIIGPHALFVWQIEGKKQFSQEQLKYLSTHTLTSSDDPVNTVNSKLLFLKDRDLVVHIFLFGGYHKMQKVTFALSLVIPYHLRDWYLSVHGFCELRLTSMVRRLGLLQEKYKNEVTVCVYRKISKSFNCCSQ